MFDSELILNFIVFLIAIKGIIVNLDITSVKGVAVDLLVRHVWTSMAFSIPKLSILDLADILAAITEVSKPYQLGIQLKIDLAELDKIDRSYCEDIDRQKTEVIKYWLCNLPDASWTTLANAVERMGGHANLVESLRESTFGSDCCSPSLESSAMIHDVTCRSLPPVCLETCVECNILLLSKKSHGNSTLGNRMLNSDGYFKINSRKCPQTCNGSSLLKSASQCQDYKITVYDHDGLFEGASSVVTLCSDVAPHLTLVILY